MDGLCRAHVFWVAWSVRFGCQGAVATPIDPKRAALLAPKACEADGDDFACDYARKAGLQIDESVAAKAAARQKRDDEDDRQTKLRHDELMRRSDEEDRRHRERQDEITRNGIMGVFGEQPRGFTLGLRRPVTILLRVPSWSKALWRVSPSRPLQGRALAPSTVERISVALRRVRIFAVPPIHAIEHRAMRRRCADRILVSRALVLQ